MKEATGELNMAVVVAISIGVLATFFFTVLWPQIKHNFQSQADCNRATCNCSKQVRNGHNGKCWCTIGDNEFACVYKG